MSDPIRRLVQELSRLPGIGEKSATRLAFFMLGAFGAWLLLKYTGIPYWGALVIVPLVVGAFGIVLERLFLSRLYHLDHLYGLLLTFGLAIIFEGMARYAFGASGVSYENPIPGGVNLGFMFLPNYRAWVIGASLLTCIATWFVIERTRLGAYLRRDGEIARAIGQPDGARAVGQALGRNPFAIVVPCHRVVGADDKLVGFSANGGIKTKLKMLKIEGWRENEPSLFDELA